jgi:hypothetical protein
MASGLETFNLVLTLVAHTSISLCFIYLVWLLRRRRDITAFKHLLWQWYASQRDAEDASLPQTATADQAFAAVLKAFETR